MLELAKSSLSLLFNLGINSAELLLLMLLDGSEFAPILFLLGSLLVCQVLCFLLQAGASPPSSLKSITKKLILLFLFSLDKSIYATELSLHLAHEGLGVLVRHLIASHLLFEIFECCCTQAVALFKFSRENGFLAALGILLLLSGKLLLLLLTLSNQPLSLIALFEIIIRWLFPFFCSSFFSIRAFILNS